MVWQALRAMHRPMWSVLLLDVQEGLTEQDLRILHLIAQAGKGCLIGLNKWDLMEGKVKEQKLLLDRLQTDLELMPYAPVLPMSVITGYQVPKVFPLIDNIYEQIQFRATTGELNRIFTDIVQRPQPAALSPPERQVLLCDPGRHPAPHLHRLYQYPRGRAGILPALSHQPAPGTAGTAVCPHPPLFQGQRTPAWSSPRRQDQKITRLYLVV